MNTRLVQDIRGPDVQRGDIEHRALPDGTTAGYAYICPNCGREDWLNVDDGTWGWTMTGSIDAPTLRPSILHRPCGYHAYLTDGAFTPC